MTAEQTAAVETLVSSAIKLAEAAQARQPAKAASEAAPGLAKKAADALVSAGFVESELLDAATTRLSDPNLALEIVHDLAVKAGSEIARLRGTDPALAAGTKTAGDAQPVDRASTIKQAEEAAAAEWVRRMSTIRKT